MSETESVNPRYTDPPVVHLEQVIYCSYCLLNEDKDTEAFTISKGNALCKVHANLYG